MGNKYTKRYTEEFKRDAIALVDSSGKTVTAVARELGVSSESLRGWYRKAKTARGEGESGELTSAEREELKRLRKENREQQQTIEILKKRNLDSSSGRAVLRLLRELHTAGTTVVVITHDREMAATFDRRIEMRDGRIVSDSGNGALCATKTVPTEAAR
ncbi:transposase [Streptomyces chartreusis]